MSANKGDRQLDSVESIRHWNNLCGGGVDALPVIHREAVILVQVEALIHGETAKILSAPIGT